MSRSGEKEKIRPNKIMRSALNRFPSLHCDSSAIERFVRYPYRLLIDFGGKNVTKMPAAAIRRPPITIIISLFPPKSINSLYGYRTKRSMADESQWREGNRFSALLMILFGLISAAAGFAGSLLIRLTQPFALIVQAVLLIAISVLIIVLTERRLKQTGRRY